MTDTAPPPGPPPGDLDGELLALALRVGRAAGAVLAEAVTGRRLEVATKSSPTDMVTEVDVAVEDLVVAELRRARPSDTVVGEERAAPPGTSGVAWCIDPIDGTTNFLYRLPGYAVSIAASVDGEPAVGVVVDVAHGEEFTARRGGGARCNGEPIAVSGAVELGRALVSTGFSYDAARRARQAAALATVLPAVRDIRRPGAASVDLCWVACGRVDAYYEKGLQPWDLAAGELIAREAGATVGDLDGGPASGAFTLAASPALFDPLRALLERSGARHA